MSCWRLSKLPRPIARPGVVPGLQARPRSVDGPGRMRAAAGCAGYAGTAAWERLYSIRGERSAPFGQLMVPDRWSTWTRKNRS